MATTLERLTVARWQVWGDGYAMFTRCSSCGEQAKCRGRRRAYMLCLICFDLNPPKGF
jgi:hypothetical protein